MDGGILKYKRLPQYMRIEEGEEFAQYLYTLNGEEADTTTVGAFWNSTTEMIQNTMGLVDVCEDYSTGLCDKRLLKGGLMLDDWKLSDEAAGAWCVFFSLANLCACLFLIIVALQILVKGSFTRILQAALGVSGYFSMCIGCVLTIIMQSSSITTSALTPLAAVGVITLEQTYPITLGANIGTTLTGVMAASVVTSNAQAGWQVALAHLFFNLIGIAIWYPTPKMREVPLKMARFLGKQTAHYGFMFCIIYVGIVFFAIPGVCYGIAKAATSA